jgi:hypothetical protein
MAWTYLDQNIKKVTTGNISLIERHRLIPVSLTHMILSVWNQTESIFFTKTGAWPTPQSPHSYTMSHDMWKDCAEDLPKEGMIVKNICYPLRNVLPFTSPDVDIERFWPTPSAQMAGESPNFLGSLTTKDGDPAKKKQTAYNPNTGVSVQITLNRAVLLWPQKSDRLCPTPNCRDWMGARRRLSEDGKNISGKGVSYGLDLNQYVKLWPTPQNRDWKDTSSSQGNRKSPNLGSMVHIAADDRKMWPTPAATTANEGESHQSWMARRKALIPELQKCGMPLAQAIYKDDPTKDKQQLNPTWVEMLMGFPIGWSIV